ncbi:MAG: CPBP family intramembrane glutamic endopeptidase [Planctomycetota bacterium]|nr:CPBP family intramembrane glutamic endopeptidase [Planctomycetota bacterium]
MTKSPPTGEWVSGQVAKRPVLWFFVLAVATEILVMAMLVVTEADTRISEALTVTGLPLKTDYLSAARLVWAVPGVLQAILLVALQPLTPTIAAFAVTAMAWQRKGLKELIARYRPWRVDVDWRQGLLSWAFCIGTFASMSLATAALNRLLLCADEYTWNQDSLFFAWIPTILIAMFLDGGGVGEETGWRGFAQPLLQRSRGPLVGTLLLGILWSLWHIPAKPDLLLNGPSHFAIGFGIFTFRLIGLSVIMAYFFNRVGGSTLIAIAMHGLHNDSLGLQGQLLSESDRVFVLSEITLLVPIVAVSVAIIVGTKGRLEDDAFAQAQHRAD